MKIAILMGSTSDYNIMQECEHMLEEFGISYETKVISAHRAPDLLRDYIKNCQADIFIAGAGKAAHLPGIIAAYTTKPVIGVPIEGNSLLGVDALLSIVQMPKGVPVATVGINQAANAGLLAIQILSLNNSDLQGALQTYKCALAHEVATSSLK